MQLTINLAPDRVTLELKNKTRPLDAESFIYYHDLSGQLAPSEATNFQKHHFIIRGKTRVYGELATGLITGLDRLLERTKINRVSIKRFKITGNLGSESTSHKIAEAFVQALKIQL